MISFNNLVNDVNPNEKIEDFLLRFLTKENFKQYRINELANKNQVKAIRKMFVSKKDLVDRIDEALSCDPFCIEALYAYMMLSEDVFVDLRFGTFYKEVSKYASFDEYQKDCYIKILNFYVEFLLDIRNVTKAIEVQRMIVKLTNNFSEEAVSRLVYSYHSIEDAEDFYRLFTDAKFDLYAYLLLLVTLLKHEEYLKAEEVLMDMYKNVEYGTYLDHVWDLDERDNKQKEFSKIVNDCYDDLCAVPTFFSWVNKTREKYGK